MHFAQHLSSIFVLYQIVPFTTATFCQSFPSIVVDDKDIVRFENGSLLHSGFLYPPQLHHVVKNRTHACVCSLTKCLRKCCTRNSILAEGLRPNCTVIDHDVLAADLRLDQYQIAPEIYEAGGIANYFSVVAGRDTGVKCYLLEPDDYADDVFFIEANGSLRTAGTMFPPSSYCLDWQKSNEKVVALICPTIKIPLEDISARANHPVLNVGMLISIPFLFVTFLVYAIIPELKNLYGKTLMCYVVSLVVAYSFVVAANYYFFPYILCNAVEHDNVCGHGRLQGTVNRPTVEIQAFSNMVLVQGSLSFELGCLILVFVIGNVESQVNSGRDNPCSPSNTRYKVLDTSSENGKETSNVTLKDIPCIEKIQLRTNSTNDNNSKDVHQYDSTSNQTEFRIPTTYFSTEEETPFRSAANYLQEGVRCSPGHACIPLCCPLNSRVVKETCVRMNSSFEFPRVYDSRTFALTDKAVNSENFDFVVWEPCKYSGKYRLEPEEHAEDAFMLLDNGSVYQLAVNIMLNKYCFGVVADKRYDVLACFDDEPEAPSRFKSIGMIVSIPFLLATFLVYSIIPELKNMHGNTLRGYVGSLLLAYISLVILQMTPQHLISDSLCITLAIIINFSFLASFFWLNVMCFDIWWTFGGFRSLQGSVKQRERKKFIMYSIYAWGSSSLLTGVCVVMDFAPGVPEHFIRPQFGTQSCWYTTDAAKAIYFYGPMGVTVLCNIYLFISTALKIVRHKKDTAHTLKGSESRRHDDNKQWFNLYLKLFIVMGISWSMEIVSWLFKDSPEYIWYITDLTNTLQGLIIFLIFVCKEKIKRLLLKRFGCLGRDVLSRNSTRSAYHSSASRTCTTSAAPLQEKINPYVTESYRTRNTFDDSDCA